MYCVQKYLNTLATVSVQYCGYSATKWLIDGCMVSNVSDIVPLICLESISDCSYGIQKQITNQKTAFCSKYRLVVSKTKLKPSLKQHCQKKLWSLNYIIYIISLNLGVIRFIAIQNLYLGTFNMLLTDLICLELYPIFFPLRGRRMFF